MPALRQGSAREVLSHCWARGRSAPGIVKKQQQQRAARHAARVERKAERDNVASECHAAREAKKAAAACASACRECSSNSSSSSSSRAAIFHSFLLLLTPSPRRARAGVPHNYPTPPSWEAALAAHSEGELPTGVDSTGLRHTCSASASGCGRLMVEIGSGRRCHWVGLCAHVPRAYAHARVFPCHRLAFTGE